MSMQTDSVNTAVDRGDAQPLASSSPMMEISNAIVKVYKETFGRGPTKTRTQFAGPDTLVVMLEGGLTTVERNLLALGEHQRLRDTRQVLQEGLEDRCRAIVEEFLGRVTVAFIIGMDSRRDVTAQVFTLEPINASSPGT